MAIAVLFSLFLFSIPATAQCYIYTGNSTYSSDIAYTYDGEYLYEGRSTYSSDIIYTFDGKCLYRGKSNYSSNILLTFDGEHVYRGRSNYSSNIRYIDELYCRIQQEHFSLYPDVITYDDMPDVPEG